MSEKMSEYTVLEFHLLDIRWCVSKHVKKCRKMSQCIQDRLLQDRRTSSDTCNARFGERWGGSYRHEHVEGQVQPLQVHARIDHGLSSTMRRYHTTQLLSPGLQRCHALYSRNLAKPMAFPRVAVCEDVSSARCGSASLHILPHSKSQIPSSGVSSHMLEVSA